MIHLIRAALAVLLVLATGVARGQTPIPAEPIAWGTWTLSSSQTSTFLSTSKVPASRWYRIRVKPARSSIELTVDNEAVNFPINMGGAALIHGKVVLLKRFAGAADIIGDWEMFPSSVKVSGLTASWTVTPPENTQVLLGKFDQPREFVVSLDGDQKCEAARIKPIIDGIPVADAAGKDLWLYPGGSLIAFGKNVRASADGRCPAFPATVTGKLAVLE